MKCLYYLSPSLDSAHTISDDLHAVGVKDWYIHVVSKNEAGLKKERIHSSNYIETMDFIRAGFIGACMGFMIGMICAVILMVIKPFGNLSSFAYIAFVAFTTLFGAWEGGLLGVATENKKLDRFHDDIEAGKYLFLIYVRDNMISTVKSMMLKKHPQAGHVATDEHYISPFSDLKREGRTVGQLSK
jgi:hypothetical protein